MQNFEKMISKKFIDLAECKYPETIMLHKMSGPRSDVLEVVALRQYSLEAPAFDNLVIK